MKARRRVLDAHDSTPTIRTNLPWSRHRHGWVRTARYGILAFGAALWCVCNRHQTLFQRITAPSPLLWPPHVTNCHQCPSAGIYLKYTTSIVSITYTHFLMSVRDLHPRKHQTGQQRRDGSGQTLFATCLNLTSSATHRFETHTTVTWHLPPLSPMRPMDSPTSIARSRAPRSHGGIPWSWHPRSRRGWSPQRVARCVSTS